MEKPAEISANSVKTYELGYLMTPLLPEEKVIELIEAKIKPLIAKLGGQLKGEDAPKMIPLAYQIRKVVEHKGSVFNEAFFGALRFTFEGEAVNSFKDELKKMNEVIRSLVIILPPDYNKKPERRIPPVAKDNKEAPIAETTVITNDAAIDKEIEGLLASK
jgi:ribosomal protein S6